MTEPVAADETVAAALVALRGALADALAYGVDVRAREGDRWDGTGLLVLGSRASIDEALRSL